jgi:4-diphosphocytidyl-2-C-methyl-D-erythritol kinase
MGTLDSENRHLPAGIADLELAHAKINLALHVTGRRSDGYHAISSLVVFADCADTIAVAPAGSGLTAEGPLAGELTRTTDPDDNLVMRAASRLAAGLPAAPPPTRFVLTKCLPVAAGIGGGSADAAATLRLLDRYWRLDLGIARLAEIGVGIGADVPMCLTGRPLLAEGIGEKITLLEGIPALPIVLAHPAIPMPTRAVFGRLAPQARAPIPPLPARFASLADFTGWLGAQRNDLSAPAAAENPLAGAVVEALAAQPDCMLARMSGSGASAFGIFPDAAAASRAAEAIRAGQPGWWATAATTGGS